MNLSATPRARPERLRLTIEVAAQQRKVMTISEQSKSDRSLIVGLPPSLVARDALKSIFADGSPTHGAAISEMRYTIHRTPRSDSINEITSHQVHKNARPEKTNQLTTAIKKDNSFAFVFGRRYSDLAPEKYNLNAEPHAQILCSYDPYRYTLITGLFVGPRDREFKYSAAADFEIFQHPFSEFRCVLLWTFLRIPSLDSSLSVHFTTVDSQTKNLSPCPGMDEVECVAHFNEVRQQARSECFELFRQQARRFPDVIVATRAEHMIFTKRGSDHT